MCRMAHLALMWDWDCHGLPPEPLVSFVADVDASDGRDGVNCCTPGLEPDNRDTGGMPSISKMSSSSSGPRLSVLGGVEGVSCSFPVIVDGGFIDAA